MLQGWYRIQNEVYNGFGIHRPEEQLPQPFPRGLFLQPANGPFPR